MGQLKHILDKNSHEHIFTYDADKGEHAAIIHLGCKEPIYTIYKIDINGDVTYWCVMSCGGYMAFQISVIEYHQLHVVSESKTICKSDDDTIIIEFKSAMKSYKEWTTADTELGWDIVDYLYKPALSGFDELFN